MPNVILLHSCMTRGSLHPPVQAYVRAAEMAAKSMLDKEPLALLSYEYQCSIHPGSATLRESKARQMDKSEIDF